MRIAACPFPAMISAALPCGSRQLASNRLTRQCSSRTTSSHQPRPRPDPRVTKTMPRDPAIAPKANHSQPLPNNRQRSATRKARTGTQPVTGNSSECASTGLASKSADQHAVAHAPTTSRASIPTSNNVRHHGPNPATVGGSSAYAPKTAGVPQRNPHRSQTVRNEMILVTHKSRPSF